VILRCLSVREPHISRIERREKLIELRSWWVEPGPLVLASCAPESRLRVLVEVTDCRPCVPSDTRLARAERALVADEAYSVVIGRVVPLRRDPIVDARRLRHTYHDDRYGGDHEVWRKLGRGERTSWTKIWYADVSLPGGNDPPVAEFECHCGHEFVWFDTDQTVDCPKCGE
jgi:hypothetical protein